MTTEEFEVELRRLQETLELSEEQIQKALAIHRRIKRGEVTVNRSEYVMERMADEDGEYDLA